MADSPLAAMTHIIVTGFRKVHAHKGVALVERSTMRRYLASVGRWLEPAAAAEYLEAAVTFTINHGLVMIIAELDLTNMTDRWRGFRVARNILNGYLRNTVLLVSNWTRCQFRGSSERRIVLMKAMTMSLFALAIFAFAGQALGQMGDWHCRHQCRQAAGAASGTERGQ